MIGREDYRTRRKLEMRKNFFELCALALRQTCFERYSASDQHSYPRWFFWHSVCKKLVELIEVGMPRDIKDKRKDPALTERGR